MQLMVIVPPREENDVEEAEAFANNIGGLALPVKTIKRQAGLKDSASGTQPVKSTPNSACVLFSLCFSLFIFFDVHENT